MKLRTGLAFCVVALGLLCGVPGAFGAGEATTVSFVVELPEAVPSGTLFWGLRHAGLELARGEKDIAVLIGGRSADGAADGPVAFEVVVESEIPRGRGPVVAHLCLGDDALRSYNPSVGDTYCAKPVGGQWRIEASRADWHKRRAKNPDSVLTVHYHRFEEDYTNVSLWTWDAKANKPPKDNELLPVGRDDFGVVFQVDTDRYGQAGDRIGFLPRLNADWQFKDGDDRIWSREMGREVYLVQRSDRVLTEVPDVSPKVVAVTIDAEHHLTVRFTHRLPTADLHKGRFRITTDSGETLTVKGVHPFKHRGDRCAVYSIETARPLEYVKHQYELHIEGFASRIARVGYILHGSKRFFDPAAKLGATYSSKQTTFRVFAPTATSVTVVIADGPKSRTHVTGVGMKRNDKGVWRVAVPGDLEGKCYSYKLSGVGFDPGVEVPDIYATCTQGKHARSMIVDLSKTDPPGFKDYRYTGSTSPADAVIYEMHVRDFTIAANSGTKAKGKYLGLTESGTHLPGDPSVKTGIDHLVELGVTHVQLMPVQDFDNKEDGTDTYNWGYMPVSFNSPDGWYASDRIGPSRIRELKEAIAAFHDRGIGVILDVVYNHAAVRAGFNKLVPGYYFRMTEGGRLSNGSGCGNEFKSENPMARKYILDSVKFWVNEYKMDGFRFDLMGLIDLETMRKIKTELKKLHPGILVYGEPWTGGATPLSPVTDKHQVRGTGVGAFNDHFRDAIKGGRDGSVPGFIQVGDNPIGVLHGLRGAVGDWSVNPVDSINYFDAHDNLTSWDKLLVSVPDGGDALRKRMARFGALILFTSQGAIFMHSGQEFCRTKQGSHNSYNLPDEINRIDWSLKKTNAGLCEYYRNLIALRKAHRLLRLRTKGEVESRVSFEKPPHDRFLVYSLDGRSLEGEAAERMLVLLNGHTEAVSFDLPEGQWSVHADADRASTKAIRQESGTVELPAHSGLLVLR